MKLGDQSVRFKFDMNSRKRVHQKKEKNLEVTSNKNQNIYIFEHIRIQKDMCF